MALEADVDDEVDAFMAGVFFCMECAYFSLIIRE